MTDRDPPRISDYGFASLSSDVRWLVSHVAALNDEHLIDVFTELEQTLSIFAPTTNFLDFLQPDVRQSRWPKVQPKKLQIAVAKLVAHSAGTSSLLNSKRKQSAVCRFPTILDGLVLISHVDGFQEELLRALRLSF